MVLMRRFARFFLRETGMRHFLVAHRHKGLSPNDVFITSYPRSGSTWLRFLIYEILSKQPATFEVVGKAIPYIGRHHSAPILLPNGGRLIKTHEPYYPVYEKVVYLVRDVRDVVVSDYAYQKMRDLYYGSFNEYISAFINGKAHGFGSWVNHVESWLNSDLTHNNKLLVINFEDLRGDTEKTLIKILRFLEVGNVEQSLIRQTIANNTIQKMRKKEDEVPDKIFGKQRRNFRFVNKGYIGGWKHQLTDSQKKLIQDSAIEILNELGYPTD